MPRSFSFVLRSALVLFTCVSTACRNSSLLDVGSPTAIIPSSALNSPATAKQAFVGAVAEFYNNFANSSTWQAMLYNSELLSDEFTATIGSGQNNMIADARYTEQQPAFGTEAGDLSFGGMVEARSALLLLVAPLATYEQGADRSTLGETYALVGYSELILAEDYCSGVFMDQALIGGGLVFGAQLTTDSLFGVAEAHFDSALAYASGNDTVTYLASVGLGRTLLQRGQYQAAATAVNAVPTSFVYDVTGASPSSSQSVLYANMYRDNFQTSNGYCNNNEFNVSNREGTVGYNYVDARDARLVLDTTQYENCDYQNYGATDTVVYVPVKFGPAGSQVAIPFATGVEARLIEAEAALQQNSASTWAADLNTLREQAPQTYLALPDTMNWLTVDSTTGASANEQIDVMFRERAFWLFGTGIRLGDMRREVRQYAAAGITADSVYPRGLYVPGDNTLTSPDNHLPYANYGTDLEYTLPTPAALNAGNISLANPYYKGCLSPTTTP